MRKRSRYKPKAVNPLAHVAAMQGAALLTRDDVLRCSMNVHAAVDAIRTGKADKDKWQDLFMAINIMEEWVNMGKASGKEVIEAMQADVVAILDRQQETGTKAVRSRELATLREVAATYTDLLAGVTHAELYNAHERTRARIKRVLSTDAPDVRVIRAPGDIE